MLYSNAEGNDLQRRDAIIVKIVFYDQKLKKKKNLKQSLNADRASISSYCFLK